MKLNSYTFILVLLISSILAGCAQAPVTGRKQLLLLSEAQEISLGIQAYNDVLSRENISQDPQINALVRRVGKRIARVADKPGYNWEFTAIDSPDTANAFALPGGKVAVYTGILAYTRDEAGLAFVLAHEVGHAIARHGGERISEQLAVQLGQQGLNIAIANKSPEALQAINIGYGIVTTFGVALPFSRQQEYEADHIGIMLMAKAGYDPHKAPEFFERMMKASPGKAPLEFLSTHPADENRIKRLRSLIPEAMKYYNN